MSAWGWLKSRFGGSSERAATVPPAMEPFAALSYGPGLSSQPAPEVLLRETLGTVASAQRAIANRIMSLQLQVKRKKTRREGTADDEILDDHALTERLERPHPDFSMRLMMRLTAQWLTSNGEAYWYKVKDGMRMPARLNPMSPVGIWPQIDRDHIDHYLVTDANGNQKRFEKNEFVRIYMPDPESPFRPEGYLGPAGIVADAHKFAMQHMRTHFENDATPKIALEAQEGAQPFANVKERDYFYRLWRQMFHSRSGAMTGVPPLLPVHWKLVQVAMHSGMEITPLLDYFRDDLLMGFGVPKSVLGLVTSGDRSSAETNQFVFDLHTIHPLTLLIADALTMHLASDYRADGIFVDFAPFVGRDKEFELRQELQDLEHGVRTINQVLRDRGHDTVPWGEKPTMVAKVGPYDPDAPPAGTLASDGVSLVSEEDEDGEEDRVIKLIHGTERRASRLRRRALRSSYR